MRNYIRIMSLYDSMYGGPILISLKDGIPADFLYWVVPSAQIKVQLQKHMVPI